MDKLIGLVALLGYLISLVVHIAALSGVDVMSYWPSVWLLHVGIFVVFIPFIFSNRKTTGKRPTYADLRATLPSWVIATGFAIFAYAAINFLLFTYATEGGSPDLRDGKFVLLNHGKLIRELTQAEYSACRANQIRGFSGHWLLFYFVPFAYFMFWKKPIPSPAE